VAEVTVEILLHPGKYVGQEIELTGPRSADLQGLAQEYTAALGRPVRYENVPIDEWRDGELRQRGLPEHVRAHILTMAKLHAAGRYDRLTDSVAAILGRPATSLTETLVEEADRFKASMSPSSAMVFPPTT
jgi:NAD(P)H dehydrogenase (quinone)